MEHIAHIVLTVSADYRYSADARHLRNTRCALSMSMHGSWRGNPSPGNQSSGWCSREGDLSKSSIGVRNGVRNAEWRLGA